MNIPNTINLSGVTNGVLQECIAQFNEEQGVDGVKATLSTTETGLVLSMGEGANRTQILITGVPELDIPDTEAVEDAAKQLEVLSEKLAELAESLKNSATTGEKTPSVNDVVDGIGSALFDIYSMIMLLLDVVQRQHQTALEINMQTFEGKAALMQAQADSIRARSAEAFRFGLASAIVQTVMTSASAALVGYSVYQTVCDVKSSGIGDAKKDLNTAEDQLKSLEKLQENTQESLGGIQDEEMEALGLKPMGDPQENLEAFKGKFMLKTSEAEKVTAGAKAEMDAKVKIVGDAQEKLNGVENFRQESAVKVTEAEKGVKKAQQAVDENAQQIKDKTNEIQQLEKADLKNEAKIKEAKGELTKLQKNQTELETELDTAVKEKGAAEETLRQAEGEKQGALEELAGAQNDALKAKTQYGEACLKQNEAMKQDLAKISGGIKEQTKSVETSTKSADKQVEQKNADVKGDDVKANEQTNKMQKLEKGAQEQAEQQGPDLKKAEKIAQKVASHDKGEFDVESGHEGLKAKVEEGRAKLDKAWNRLGNSESGRYATALKALGDTCNQISSTVNSFMSIYKDKAREEGEAERKIIETEIESKNATQEQARDLVQTSAEEINKLRQLLGEVTQSMKQVERDIFG